MDLKGQNPDLKGRNLDLRLVLKINTACREKSWIHRSPHFVRTEFIWPLYIYICVCFVHQFSSPLIQLQEVGQNNNSRNKKPCLGKPCLCPRDTWHFRHFRRSHGVRVGKPWLCWLERQLVIFAVFVKTPLFLAGDKGTVYQRHRFLDPEKLEFPWQRCIELHVLREERGERLQSSLQVFCANWLSQRSVLSRRSGPLLSLLSRSFGWTPWYVQRAVAGCSCVVIPPDLP